MNTNWKKMIASLFTTVLVLGASSTLVQAEELSESPFDAETIIEVKVNEGEIVNPPGGGGGEENPGGQKGQLAIWVKPETMSFEGNYDQIRDYTLNLRDNQGQRRLGIADIRSKEAGWKLTAKLGNLTLNDSDTKSSAEETTIDAGNYRMSMNLSAQKYLPNEDGSEGQYIDDENIQLGKGKSNIIITNNETSIAEADNTGSIGKGYTFINMKDIELEIDAGKGFQGNHKGKVIWELASTAN